MASGPSGPQNEVLALDSSMLVEEPATTKPALEPVLATVTPLRAGGSAASHDAVGTLAAAGHLSSSTPLESQAPVISMQSSAPAEMSASGRSSDKESLVAPEAAAAASSAVSSLMRKLSSERNASVSRGGPTLEDLVREEMRPMLKQWLDTNLAPIVERLVRAEIERVVNNAAF